MNSRDEDDGSFALRVTAVFPRGTSARTGYFKRLHALSDALIAFRPALADEEEEEDGGLISASFVYLCSPAFGEMYVTEETEAAQKQPENMNLNDF